MGGMVDEGIPVIGVRNLDTGAEILLDIDAARHLANEILNVFLHNLSNPNSLMAGTVIEGVSGQVPNEHGELLLWYSIGGHR
jgi:hypothetical protein